MSFKKLTKEELAAVAAAFGVDVEPENNEQDIIISLMEEGVTWDVYQQSLPKPEEEDFAVVMETTEDSSVAKVLHGSSAAEEFRDKEPTHLLKMQRANPTFEIRGYKFTKAHPFAVVKEGDVNYLLNQFEGFRIATPTEVQEFYK